MYARALNTRPPEPRFSACFQENRCEAQQGNVCVDWLTLRITFVIVHVHVQCDNRIGSCRSRKAHTCRADRAVMSLVWERVTRSARSALDQDSGRSEPPSTEPRSLVTWWHIPDYCPEPSPADRLMRSRPGSHCSHGVQVPRLGVLGAALGRHWHERRDGLVAGLKPARRQGVGGRLQAPPTKGPRGCSASAHQGGKVCSAQYHGAKRSLRLTQDGPGA